MYFKVTDNYLSQDELTQINEIIDKKGYTFGWKSHVQHEYRHWNLLFAGSKSYKDEFEITKDQLEDEIFWNIWERINLDGSRKLIRLYSNAYTYGTEGTFHTDSKNNDGQTHLIYINPTWDINWAGETVFAQGNEIARAVIPKPGRLVEFSGTIFHAARSVSKFCPTARKVLVYKSVV